MCIGALLTLLPLQVIGLTTGGDDVDGPSATRTAPATLDAAPPPTTDAGSEPAPAPPLGESASPAGGALVTEPDVAPATTPRAARATSAPTGFAARYPAQAAALQDPRQPDTTRWALLIGINEHLGRVSDNIGSRQDAEAIRAQLLANGWRDDHILLITDRDATRATILAGIEWLAAKTDGDSVAVFHYAGHSKKWYGQDHDRDGEVTDEGLWPTDDRFIPDSELVAALAPVAPRALWVNFATCNAAGFADPGLARPGRLLTFSSGEPQKSYEHPSWQNSVWGYWLVEQAMAGGKADADGDGRVTVEEAFAWARPRARETTVGQSHGAQDAVIVDQVDGDFDLAIPGVAPAPGPVAEQPSPPPPETAPAPTPAPGGGGDAPPPDREEPDEPDRICLLCGAG